MKLRIRHRTTYNYRQPVSFGSHRILIRPREGHDVHIESSILDIRPAHLIRWMRDVNGNCIAQIDFTEPAAQLMIYSELTLQDADTHPLDFALEENAVHYPFVYDPETQLELAAFMHPIYPKDTARLREWLIQFWKPDEKIQTLALLQRVNRFIYETFRYQRRDERGVQTPAETLRKNSGSCRDFATLLLEAFRCWGLAARFVSGYMQCKATEAGGASTHAWTEVYLPGAGWKGFDPTCGLVTGSRHVTVAVVRDPENASPVAGSFTGPGNSFVNIQVDVSVVQTDGLEEHPVHHGQYQQQPPAHVLRQVEQMAQQAPPMEMVIQPFSSPGRSAPSSSAFGKDFPDKV